MPNTSLRLFVVFAVLGALTAWPQVPPPATNGEKTAERTTAVADAPPLITTPDLFQVVNPDALKLGKLLDYEKRDIRITLRNISDQAWQIEGVRVTCGCLSMLEKTPPCALKPGEELHIAVRIDAGHIKLGPFKRMILVDVAGRDTTLVNLTGEVIPMLSYSPAQVVNLGSFAGENVPWERKFTLKTLFPPTQQVTLLPPPEDSLFSYELTTLEPQSYSLLVKPKLPLPKGKFHQVINLPVQGLDQYGPVMVALAGQVTGWRLMLENPDLSFSTAGMKHDEAITKEIRLVLRDDSQATSRGRGLARAKQHGHDDDKDKDVAVAKDELASDQLKELAMWEALAKTVEAFRLPPGVTMTTSAAPGAVIATLTFPPQFFASTRRFIVPFTANKSDCGRLIIQAAR